MRHNECCGWASWGELAGMGDGHTAVDGWERPEGDAGSCGRERASTANAPRWHSGRRARAQLAMLRWRLGERNKRG